MNQKEDKQRIIEGARRLGIADERAIRNIAIKDEFYEIRKARKMSYKETISFLALKYFMSESGICNIIFRKFIKKI